MPGALPFDILSSSSGQSRIGFERIPQNLTRTELFRYFTFSVEDHHEILECRGDHNRGSPNSRATRGHLTIASAFAGLLEHGGIGMEDPGLHGG